MLEWLPNEAVANYFQNIRNIPDCADNIEVDQRQWNLNLNIL